MTTLSIENLSITYDTKRGPVHAVRNVSFSIEPGEVLAIVGETGSGKTTTAQSIIGLLGDNARITSGRILLNEVNIAGWSPKRLEIVRGKRVGLIPQDPGTSLDPLRRVGWQIGEVLRTHGQKNEAAITARVSDLLTRVGLPDTERIARAFPHELSGGQRQRVLIASAIALHPLLLIADEATSALDVTVQRRILDLIDELRRDEGSAVLFVTHDLGVAAERADKIVVLKNGRVQDSGPTAEVLANPTSDYTRALIGNAPVFQPVFFRPVPRPTEPAIVVQDLTKQFRSTAKIDPAAPAVDGVSFSVPRGTTHAIVGESGSGKTTTARIIMGFELATAGSVSIDGTPIGQLRGAELRRFRRKIQLVYQNPFGSLSPKRTILDIVAEPVKNFGLVPRGQYRIRAAELLERVAIDPSLFHRRPRELSGGQRQRVAIARALAVEPEIVVLDEAVSALDVTVQAQILDLLEELQRDLGLTYLFISHDLNVVRRLSDTVTVLRGGVVEESGTTEEIFTRPRTEYTRELLAAIPRAGSISPALVSSAAGTH